LKGFHIHVNGIELAVRPGHKPGMIVFKRWFRRDSWADVDAAQRIAIKTCLASRAVREKWMETLVRGREFLDGYDGDMQEKANGRKREFRWLEKWLMVYKEE